MIKLKRRVYGGDPDWVPPLRAQVRRDFSPSHPYNARGSSDLLVLFLDGEPVGSAAVFFDVESSTAFGGRAAYFAYFEVINDVAVAERLVEGLEEWACRHGANELVGPMSPRISDPRGVLIEGAGPPVFGMAYNPQYYPELLDALGFVKATDLFEFIVPCRHSYPRLDRVAELALRRLPGLQLRSLDLENLERECKLVADMYNEAWRANLGFIPLDYEDLLFDAKFLRHFLRPTTATVVELDGKPVGFQMMLPDINSAIRAVGGRLWPFGWLRLKYLISRERVYRGFFIGVLPKYRKVGIEALLIRSGVSIRAQRVHIGWVLESNFAWRSEISNLAGGDISHRLFRIYRRPLERRAAHAHQ